MQEALALRPCDPKTGKPLTRLAFPSPRDPSKPITRAAVTRAMTRTAAAINAKRLADHVEAGGDAAAYEKLLADAGPHDLRRSGATAITSERIGIPRFTVSLVLGHRSETGGVTRTYDRNAYLPEKRRALDAWAALLMEVVVEKPKPGKVVKMRTDAKAK